MPEGFNWEEIAKEGMVEPEKKMGEKTGKETIEDQNDLQTEKSRYEIPHSIEGIFRKNDDGTITIETKLEGLSADLLPDHLKEKESGELVLTLGDYNSIAKKVLNELLNTSENEEN